MKKLSLFYSLLFLISLGFITSCGSEEDDPTPITPDECSTLSFPASSSVGSAVEILNFTSTSGGFTNIQAEPGDVLALAVQVTKGDKRPQKLRVYQTDCENALGDIVTFSGQDTEDGGKRFDLRNTDEPQIRNINYTVPSGIDPIYLNIEVDESGGEYTYKRIKIDVSGSGIVDTYTGITLGAQSSAAPSRLVSSTGQGYTVCNAAGNINYIDITYLVYNNQSYLASNPARYETPFNIALNVPTGCGDDPNLTLDGGVETVFESSALDFDNVSNTDLDNLTFGSGQYITISNGSVIAFQTSEGRKGLIKITGGTLNSLSGDITVDVKVQR